MNRIFCANCGTIIHIAASIDKWVHFTEAKKSYFTCPRCPAHFCFSYVDDDGFEVAFLIPFASQKNLSNVDFVCDLSGSVNHLISNNPPTLDTSEINNDEKSKDE